MSQYPPRTASQLFAFLDELAIDHETVAHPPVFTVAEAKELRGSLAGGHAKSLFLKNKKRKMWLVVVSDDQKVDLAVVAKSLGSKRLSFASPERLLQHLGVTPGSVTPFAVINDDAGAVSVAVSADLLAIGRLNFHPLVNDRTTSVTTEGLLAFLEAVDHRPRMLSGEELVQIEPG